MYVTYFTTRIEVQYKVQVFVEVVNEKLLKNNIGCCEFYENVKCNN